MESLVSGCSDWFSDTPMNQATAIVIMLMLIVHLTGPRAMAATVSPETMPKKGNSRITDRPSAATGRSSMTARRAATKAAERHEARQANVAKSTKTALMLIGKRSSEIVGPIVQRTCAPNSDISLAGVAIPVSRAVPADDTVKPAATPAPAIVETEAPVR